MDLVARARTLPFRRVGIFLSASVVGQGLAAVSGLLIARWMSVNDYGIYTVVIVIMGALSILTKGGAHLGFTAILGRVWPDKVRSSEAVQALLLMRRRISAITLPAVLAVAAGLFVYNGAPWWIAALLVGLLVLFWWADIRTRLIDQILYFAKQTTQVQMLDAALAGGRLLAVLGLYALGLLNLISAVVLSVLVAMARIPPITRWVAKLLPGDKPQARQEDVSEIGTAVRRQMPVDLYYVLQAQIVILLLSLFGSLGDLAGFGAITRLQQLLLPVEAFTYAFCVPIFARAASNILGIYFGLVAVTMIPGICLVGLAYVAPWTLLWLVGPNYSGLENEILVAAVAAVFTRGASTAWSLVAHRGWVRYSWVQVPVGLLACVSAIYFFDVGTVTGALVLQGAFALGWLAAAAVDLVAASRRGELK